MDLLQALQGQADASRAADMRAYHKVERVYLGVPNGQIETLARQARQSLSALERLELCHALWDSDIFEARIAVGKMLTQARLKEGERETWQAIKEWCEDLDSWAIADQLASSAAKRLVAHPERLKTDLALWAAEDHLWKKRFCLVATLPWSKLAHPKEADLEAQELILSWAESYCDDHRWFIQKVIGWWLRDFSRHNPRRVMSFLEENESRMKSFAIKEAKRLMKKGA